jgi:hypothetical protein
MDTFPPVTPKKLRPFKAMVSPSNRHRSISPPPDIDIGVNSTPLPGSSGMFLLIRNVLPDNKTGFGDPIVLVKKALTDIISTDDGKELADIDLVVIAGGRPQDRHSASAYLELAQQVKMLDSVPRPDLLIEWMNALRMARPSWEVVWAPQKKGKDRRMIVRFRVADIKDKVPAGAPDRIRTHLESKGHRTLGGYISYNGLVDITLADTHSVDSILASTYYFIPSLSKEGLHVSPPKFIPINNPFELCIGGLNDYEGLHEIIEKWLYYKYVQDDAAKTTRVFDTRISPDREYFIFTMDSWESTVLVLKDVEAFRAYFAQSPNLTDPKLLFESNSSGFARKSTATTIDAGANVVNDAISGLKRELADFRKEQNENNNLVQRQVAAIHANMESQTNAVALIGNQLQQFGLSLLAGRDEKAIEGKIYAIDNSIAFENQCLRTTENPAEKHMIATNITSLQNERREQTRLLAKASDTTLMLIGPAPGTIIPTPPSHKPAQLSNNTIPSANSLIPTTLPGLPPAASPPRAVILDSSSDTTILPISTAKSAASKRAKTVHPHEKPAKRPKQLPLLTRSASKTTLNTQTGEDVNMDLYNNETETMVCPHFPINSPFSTMARADPDQCYTTGSRPLMAVTKDILNVSDVLGRTDQPGHECFAKTVSRNLSCHSHPSKSIPSFVTWIIIVLILFLFINPTVAIPTSESSLSLFALNTNGFVHPMKIDATNRAISHRNPDIVVISETKTNSIASSKMSYDSYQFFEERGTPVTGHHLYKWGIILGIKKGITVSQRITINHPALIGRLIVVDIVIPLDTGQGFTHRILAVYAPWDVHDTTETAAFWSEVTKLCLNTPSSWTLLGDLNATVTQAERKTGGTDARIHFNNFLRQSNGFDLWSAYPERSRLVDWTCRPRSSASTDGGSIIDRIVTSSSCFLDSEIKVADGYHDFVPMTDHRAVIGRLILKPPNRVSAQCLHDAPTPILNAPRIKFPPSKDKHLFQIYRDATDIKVERAGLHDRVVTDQVSFNLLYSEITKIINDTAVEVFGTVKRKPRDLHKTVTNPLIQRLQARSRAIGGALRLNTHPTHNVSQAARQTLALLSAEYSSDPTPHTTLRSFLIAKRKTINKNLYKERSDEVYARAKKYDSFRISQALAGGSTKRLVQTTEFIPLPMSINTIDGTGKLLTSPSEVKTETRKYWENLYARQPIPDIEKPWLSTKSVKDVHDRVSSDPFQWPRKANITDFRALIRKGNMRPSPGPDGMEKWCVKSLTDYSLTPILELHNYMTINSCFPGDIKDMYLTMFHKRGLRTDLNNWRGLMISNFLANSPMTWLNHLLTPYIAINNILPDTQVATQQGVQTRDLTSCLSGILTWANRHNTTVYALKRDQMKGFDYLAPEGFYDAISAYGLPDAIIDIDKAAQTNTKVFIRTAHGLTEPIIVSGVAKQGGPISPLKSTLTTSLGHRYLDDVANITPGALTITSSTYDRLDPHQPDDNICLPIRMTEATDDSIIFAKSIQALQTFCLLEERFQFAYGWYTNWLKTVAFVLSPAGTQPDTITMPSITIKPGVSPMVVTSHTVSLVPNELEFLRVKIDNPSHRFRELHDFIEAFTFPKFIGPTPITLVRKIVMQSIASRARALLTLQPITDADALKLDRLIAAKVHATSGFPWIFNTEIATLPVSLHGFDFPSIRRINASIAVDGLARDLNHHIPAYRNMARITLADWTCSINDCINPLEGVGIHKDFTRRIQYHTIPAAWIIAQKEMGTMTPPLRLCSTDQSHILNGDVSISHCLKLIKTHNISSPDGSAAYSLRAAGFKLVKQLGEWISTDQTIKFQPYTLDNQSPLRKKPTAAAKTNWKKITTALSRSSIDWFFHGSYDLLTPRLQRRDHAEDYIIALAHVSNFSPSSCHHANSAWATDGSMIPAASGISDKKTVTAAVTGPSTLVLQVKGRNTSILQGEQMGLLAALVLAQSPPQIYTDHLNSTTLIDDSRTAINQERRLRVMNGRSYYRWILDLVSRKSATITYTKAHTNDTSLPSTLNRQADHYASSAQKFISSIPIAPVPSFFMEPYTFHREPDGWIESNIRHFVDHFSAIATADKLALMPRHRMSTWLHDPNPPPPWIYTKAPSAYTALVQLYARSGQLVTAHGMCQKKALASPICRFGCPDTENPHHLFIVCPRYSEMRLKALESLTMSIKTRLDEDEVNTSDQQRVLDTVKYIFSDSENTWPLHSSMYYLGQLPKLEPLLSPLSSSNTVNRARLIRNLAADMHLASARLASRIYGDLQTEMTKRRNLFLATRS